MTSPETPELDKLEASDFKAIVRFLAQTPYFLAEEDTWDELVPTYKSSEEIAAEHLGIDLKKVEAERRALLEYQQHLNEKP